MTKREQEQRRRDLEGGQRAFDALRPEEREAIVSALHAGEVEALVEKAQFEWYWLVRRFENDAAEAAKTVKKWPARIDGRAPEHLHNELEWMDSLFEAAAVAHVSHEVLLSLRNWGPERTRRYVTSRLISAARPGASSSHSANLMGYLEARALGRALESLESW